MTDRSRRKFFWCLTMPLLAGIGTGCGTLLYPERRGQPAGPLDWKVVLLDGIGLIFFFIPGVIAFAVDFLNGTIYLPPEATYGDVDSSKGRRKLVAIKVPRHKLTQPDIERVISEHINKSVSLDEKGTFVCQMESVDDFWQLKRKYATPS